MQDVVKILRANGWCLDKHSKKHKTFVNSHSKKIVVILNSSCYSKDYLKWLEKQTNLKFHS